MSGTERLSRIERIVQKAGIAPRIEARLSSGVRPRQLSVATLLIGILLTFEDSRPAHLTRVHKSLIDLEWKDRCRLGIEVTWNNGTHLLTYRQVERTFSLIAIVCGSTDSRKPSLFLQECVDALVEASIGELYKTASSSYAVDWTDIETFAHPVRKDEKSDVDPDASWGHRRGKHPGQKDEMFFGYFCQFATMVNDEQAGKVPELGRRMMLTSCEVDPPQAFVPVLASMAASGIAIRDVLCDSGYSHRVPEHWALPIRRIGANLVMDLHPYDRGTKGTHTGAILFNGNLYCPSTPKALFLIEPLSRSASLSQVQQHDQQSEELSHYKLGRISADDADGYHRVMCPAAMGKVRCPLRGDSMTLSYKHLEIQGAPLHPPRCCSQQTITVPPTVNAKTAQKHDYPSPEHRKSYGRRTSVERTNSTIKDPATTNVGKGWSRKTGLATMTLFLACLVVVRNLRIEDAFEQHQEQDARRIAQGHEPKTRRRRRKTINELIEAPLSIPSPSTTNL